MSFNCQRPLEYILTRISSYLFVFHETRGGGGGGKGRGSWWGFPPWLFKFKSDYLVKPKINNSFQEL